MAVKEDSGEDRGRCTLSPLEVEVHSLLDPATSEEDPEVAVAVASSRPLLAEVDSSTVPVARPAPQPPTPSSSARRTRRKEARNSPWTASRNWQKREKRPEPVQELRQTRSSMHSQRQWTSLRVRPHPRVLAPASVNGDTRALRR